MYPGAVSKHDRAHFALTHMCPSILAAAFTTFAAASVMVSVSVFPVSFVLETTHKPSTILQ